MMNGRPRGLFLVGLPWRKVPEVPKVPSNLIATGASGSSSLAHLFSI